MHRRVCRGRSATRRAGRGRRGDAPPGRWEQVGVTRTWQPGPRPWAAAPAEAMLPMAPRLAPGPRGSGARVGAQGPGTPLCGRRALPGPCRCERLPRLHSSGLSLKTSFIFRTVLECWKGRDAGAGVPAPPRLPRCSSLLRLASPCPSERGRRAVPQLCLVQGPLVFT